MATSDGTRSAVTAAVVIAQAQGVPCDDPVVVEYDLAALVHRQRIHGGDDRPAIALAAYGEHDADLLDAALPVYAAWIAASWLVALPRRPEIEEGVKRQLTFLRGYRL